MNMPAQRPVVKPQVVIRRRGDRLYDYSIRLRGGKVRYERHGLCSLTECLHDSATALGMAFAEVELFLDGVALGSYSQPTLEHDPVLLAGRLEALVASAKRPGAAAPGRSAAGVAGA